MNRRHFLMSSIAATAAVRRPSSCRARPVRATPRQRGNRESPSCSSIRTGSRRPIDERIYGHFLEHINHSVVDGLFAEQIRGCGFEGEDFKTYWEPFSDRGSVEIADVEFRNGKKSVRLHVEGGRAGIRQGRLYVDAGHEYDGSLWVRREAGLPAVDASRRKLQGRPDRVGAARAHRLGLAGGPLFLLQSRAGHAGLGGDRGSRQWNAAARLRLDDARGRPPRRHAAPRPAAGPARSRSALHPLARGLLRFHLQVEGRHRPARLAPIPPQHDLGRLLGLLRLRDGGVPGALPEAQHRAPDRAGGARHRLRAGSVRHGLGPLPERPADHRMGTAAGVQRASRALRRPATSRSTTSP